MEKQISQYAWGKERAKEYQKKKKKNREAKKCQYNNE